MYIIKLFPQLLEGHNKMTINTQKECTIIYYNIITSFQKFGIYFNIVIKKRERCLQQTHHMIDKTKTTFIELRGKSQEN